MIKYKHYILVIFLLSFWGALAQSPLDIRLYPENSKDTALILAYYYGDRTFVVDTAFRQKNSFEFSADTLLPKGIYIVAGNKNKRLFELIMDEHQVFNIYFDREKSLETLTFKISEVNTAFYEHIRLSKSVLAEIKELKLPDDQFKADSLHQILETYKSEYISLHPESLLSKIFLSMKNFEFPSAIDSLERYPYLIEHYFDHFNLSDPGLLRTPVYHRKITEFLDHQTYPHIDSLKVSVDKILSLAGDSPETYKYLLWNLTHKFEHTNVMGYDAVYVHLLENYYLKNTPLWIDSVKLEVLEMRATQLKRTLIGQLAPNLIMMDSGGIFRSLHHTEAKYTILLFYDPDCSHCKKEISVLEQWKKERTDDLEIFAVCSDVSKDRWKTFIKEKKLDWIHVYGPETLSGDYHVLYNIYKTPTIFLLDDNKNILAKQLDAPAMKSFIERLEKSVLED